MSFVEPAFPALLAVALLGVAVLRGRARQLLLLAVSLVFYGWADPRLVGLLLGVGLVAWGAGLAVARWPSRRRLWLGLAALGTLGPLIALKYLDLLGAAAATALGAVGVHAAWAPTGWLLPVGISFYTLQGLAYVVDVHRGRLPARRDPVDVLLFVAFFPQLVAGPIERAAHLLPQLDAPRRPDAERLASGLSLALWGAVQKVCVADGIAPFVDRVFALPSASWPLVVAGTLAFALQILADFSGYTDLARGAARMVGVELVPNFRHPYLATSPRDFWRRWHVSFSTWIRDYVYIPLGGSRQGPARTALATVAAMLLSGLWHGASASFVLWGAWHALLLLAQRAVQPRLPAWLVGLRGSHHLARALTFLGVLVGWTLFRETRLDRLVAYAALRPWTASRDDWVVASVLLVLTTLLALPLLAALALEGPLARVRGPWRWTLRTTGWTLALLALASTVRVGEGAFLYFRF